MSSDSGEVLDCKTLSFLHPARAVGEHIRVRQGGGLLEGGRKMGFYISYSALF